MTMRGGSIIKNIIIIAFLIMGCEPTPQPINLGSDQCVYCRMLITDQEFGSQILNTQGRSFKFDSVECMAAFDLTDKSENIHSKWVPEFLARDNWLRAEEAYYLHSETLRSPMGLYLTSYSSREDAEQMKAEYGGEIVNYQKVLEIVRSAWLTGDRSGMNHHNSPNFNLMNDD